MRNGMRWTKGPKKILAPFAVTTLLFFFSDFLLGQYLNDGVYMCRDAFLHHKYCPQSKRTYRMTEFDGGKVIDSYWNRDQRQ